MFRSIAESHQQQIKYCSFLSLFLACFTTAAFAAPVNVEHCKASFYGQGFAGKKTASGTRFNPNAMTAASNHLPLGSKVMVKNKSTGKNVRVTITDRGPGKHGRGIDLSKAAAKKIGMTGVAPVSVTPLMIASKHHHKVR